MTRPTDPTKIRLTRLNCLSVGAAEAVAGETGYRRDPADEAFMAPWVAKAREARGAPAFDAAQAVGRGLSYESAIDEAHAWLVTLT